MDITVLGCSGGIGGKRQTTSFLVGDHVLIDAGTGVGSLSLTQLVGIDHLFLTHEHLDHVALLPLLVDSVMALRESPLLVYAQAETIDSLKAHMFNWRLWPDFTQLPSADTPAMRFVPITLDETIEPIAGLQITAVPARHTVPAVGYLIRGSKHSWAFSGDTGGQCPEFWQRVNAEKQLAYLVIETAFPDEEQALAEAAKHLCPALLAEELYHFTGTAQVYITHLKPGADQLIMQQIENRTVGETPLLLQNEHTFSLS